MRWLLVAVGIAVCALAGVASTAVAQTPAQSYPAELARESTDALNRGDRGAFLGLFTDDAVIEGFPDCYTPCVGTQAVTQEFNLIVSARVHVTISDTQVSDNTMTSHFEATSAYLTQLHIDRVVGTFTVTVRDNKIASASFVLDPNDPQTAIALRLLAPVSATPQPQPPRAGAGWQQTSPNDSGTLIFALAVAGIVATIGALAAGFDRHGGPA